MDDLRQVLVLGIDLLLFLVVLYFSKRHADKHRLLKGITLVNENKNLTFYTPWLLLNSDQKEARISFMGFALLYAVVTIPLLSLIVGYFLK